MFLSQKYGFPVSSFDIIFDRKFDTALRNSTVPADRQTWSSTQIGKTFMSNVNSISTNVEQIIDHTPIYPFILKTIIDTPHPNNPTLLRSISKCIHRNVNLQLSYIHEGSTSIPQSDAIATLNDIHLHLPADTWIQALSQEVQIFGKLVEQYGRSRETNTISPSDRLWKHPIIPLWVVWTKSTCFIKIQDEETYLPSSYILLIHNKICDLLSVYVLNFTRHTNDRVSRIRMFRYFIIQLMSSACKLRTRFFSVVKLLEAFAVGKTLIEVDGITNDDFLQSMDRELTDLKIPRASIRFIDTLLDLDIIERHEYSCLSKLMGHPVVDMQAGADALEEKVNRQLSINMDYVVDSIRFAKKSFVKGYILRHRSWPPVEFVYKHAALGYACLTNLDPDSLQVVRKYGYIPHSAYDSFELTKCLEFNTLENYLPYLKDKAISVIKSEAWARYIDSDESLKYRRSDTQLLLHYLLGTLSELDHLPVLKKYQTGSSLNLVLEYLAIRIVPKEKELKEIFRGFGCKTAMSRAITQVQERNCMHVLDLYSYSQAMTLSELALAKKLHSFRTLQKVYQHHTPVYLVVDSQAWNNFFRKQTTDTLLRETLDKIYGTNLFCKTMLAFEKTLVYIPSEDFISFWEGQKGGIEGLNQDSWVFTYISQIMASLASLGYPYHILCKGDDLRIVLMIPDYIIARDGIQAIKLDILTLVKDYTKELGHTIKLEESYSSCHYLAFSKQASVDNILLPQTFRKIQKVYGATNAFLPFIDDYIGATFSNAHSSAAVCIDPLACYSVALFWTYLYLLSDKIYKQLTLAQLTGLTLVPSMLGGFPIIYYHNFFVRAESDLLSPFLGLRLHAEQHDYEVYRAMDNFLRQKSLDPKEAFQGLLQDPYSLPLQKPIRPEAKLRSYLKPAVERICRNESIKQLMTPQSLRITKTVVDSLFSANRYNSKIFSAIYASTPSGVMDSLLRQFETARSIKDLLILKGRYQTTKAILDKVIDTDNILQNYRLKLVQRKGYPHPHLLEYHNIYYTCPSLQAQAMRNILWQRPVDSVTMPPLQHQIRIVRANTLTWDMENHFLFTWHPPTQVLNEDLDYATANKTPFLGYRTTTGITQPQFHFEKDDIIIQKFRNLLDLRVWTVREGWSDSNLSSIIDFLLPLYTSVHMNRIVPFTGGHKGGTIQHHVRAPGFREGIVPNHLTNCFTMITGNSETHLTIKKSQLHYQINFLHIHCYVTLLVHMHMRNNASKHDEAFWAVTSKCIHCTTPIVEPAIILEDLPLEYDCCKPLLATKIGSWADQLIEEASMAVEHATLVAPKDYDMSIDDEYTDAVFIGLIQQYMDSLFFQRKRLLDASTSHSMTPEAVSTINNIYMQSTIREIGVTEIKRVPANLLWKILILIIGSKVVHDHPNWTESDMLYYLKTVPINTLPWYETIIKLYKNEKIGEVCKACADYCGDLQVPSILAGFKDVILYLSHKSYSEFIKGKEVYNTIIIVGNYVPLDITNYVNVYRTSLTMMVMTYLDDLWLLQQRETVLYCVAFLLHTWLYSEEATQLMIKSILDTKKEKIYLYDDYSDYNFYNYLDQSDHVVNEGMQLLTRYRLNPQEIKDIYDEFCADFCDDVDRVYSFLWSMSPIEEKGILSINFLTIDNIIRLVRLRKLKRSADLLELNSLPSLPVTTSIIISDRSVIIGKSLRPGFIPAYEPPNLMLPDIQLKVSPIPTWFYYRPYCIVTSACNKLLECLKVANITLGDSLDRKNISCLGDGFGGFTLTMNKICTNSLLLYNSLLDPEDNPFVIKTHLDSVLLSENHNNKLDATCHLRTLHDLTSQEFVDLYLTKYSRNVFLITCDAETQFMDYEKRKTLVQHVIRIFHEAGQSQGILILKLYINEPKINSLVLGTFDYLGHAHYQIKPHSSGYNSEFYVLVVHSDKYKSLKYYYVKPGNLSILHKEFKLLLQKNYPDCGMITQNTRLYPQNCPSYILPLEDTYIYLKLQKLTLISQVDLRTVMQLPHAVGILNELHNISTRLIESNLHTITMYQGLDDKVHELNTLAHVLRLSEVTISTLGLKIGIVPHTLVHDIAVLNWQESVTILHSFCSRIKRLPNLKDSCDFSNKTNVYRGVEHNIVQFFTKGISLGLSFRNYLQNLVLNGNITADFSP